jgi:hypothetical protein
MYSTNKVTNRKGIKMETMEIMEVAVATEELLHKVLTATTVNPFELDGARVYGVENGETFLIGTHPDIYDLLADEDCRHEAKSYSHVAVVTSGWAAPLNEQGEVEGAPSQHPMRRRVRLVVCANTEDVSSVLRFSDEPENVITDPGKATGSLADAIQQFVAE